MSFTLTTVTICVGMFIAVVVAVELGRRVGVRKRAKATELPGSGAVEASVFALLGLLVAFTFQGAASRFDTRRQLIVDETNAIGTAYLRVDLLPADAQPAVRALFQRYVDTRLEVYRVLPDLDASRAALERANALQTRIWQASVAAALRGPPSAPILLLSALNTMIDVTTTRTMATEIHPPFAIFAMLGALALVSALFVGYGMASSETRSWLHVIGLALTLAVTIFVILEIEFPRMGFIRVDAFDHALADLRARM